MLLDPNIGALIKSIKARIYGIDLRWLAHAHGAVQNSEKEIHEGPVVLGGLSATHYWREALQHPQIKRVDF